MVTTLFVGGAIRSGTTLLQRLLSQSPDCNDMVAECQYLLWQMNLYQTWQGRFEPMLEEFFGERKRFDQYTQKFVQDFLAHARTTLNSPKTLLLKSPQLTPYFPTLTRWIPEAGVVVIVRDPRDVIVSMLEVGERQSKDKTPSEIAAAGRDMTALAGYYKSFYADVVNQRRLMGDRILFIRYKRLVESPRELIEAICFKFGLRTPPVGFESMVATEKNLQWHGRTDADGVFWTPFYGKPVDPTRVGRFQASLSSDEVAVIENVCADMNQVFGFW